MQEERQISCSGCNVVLATVEKSIGGSDIVQASGCKIKEAAVDTELTLVCNACGATTITVLGA